MKLQNLFLVLTFFLSLNITSAMADIQDVTYKFDPAKISAATDTFHFLRSFVDYFYLLIKNNPGELQSLRPLTAINGWCIGDAHPENFGFIIKKNNELIFTANDMDDSGPAPVIYDLFRLMVSSKLYDRTISLDKLTAAYSEGLQKNNFPVPPAVLDMQAKAREKGTLPSKNKIENNKIVRTDKMNELSTEDLTLMKSIVQLLKDDLHKNAVLIDAVETSKTGGGSGGLLRYELLIDNGGPLLHLELKTEITPSIYPVANGNLPSTTDRINQTILVDQESNPSPFYRLIKVKGQDMLLRPRFSGNVGVDLSKQSTVENEDIIFYEAYTLGLIHSRSLGSDQSKSLATQLKNISPPDIERSVGVMVDFFDTKFTSIK